MTATEGTEKIKQLVNQGCEEVVVCLGDRQYAIKYDDEKIVSSCHLASKMNLLAKSGQLCVAHESTSTVTLKVVDAPMIGDMLVMSINRQGKTIVINAKERADG